MRNWLLAAAATAIAVAMAATQSPSGLKFTDVTAQAGIRFTHNSGRAGKKYLPETLGSGCAFFDADGDGWPDILLINSKDWTPRGRKSLSALYRNNHNGTFTNITAGSGLDVEMYGMGVAIADYDNDGRDDVYITALDGDHLFHNEGNGKFRDVTKESGIHNASFGTSAAWFDYDRDGKVDLFVANYVQWDPKHDLWCSLDGATKSYCTPESYKGTASRLYHNLGNGKFEDVAAKAGVGDPTSKSLGVTVLDYNSDGWPDLFVSNDTQPNKLYRNNRNGTFTEEGMTAGVAYGEDGVARGAMGADAADYDGSGRPALLVGNFSNQMLGLYHNEGNGLFVDEAPRFHRGPGQLADPGLRRLLLRLRPRRPPRHFRRQRPHRRRDRPRTAQGELQGASASFPQPGRAEVRERIACHGRILRPPHRGARRRLRRFRPRWRPRRSRLHQQRPGLPVP